MENGRLDNRELHILEEFKQGRLELFYRHVYPGLLLFAVRHAGEVHDDYLRRLYRLGTMATYADAAGQFTGCIVDVRRHGRLVIEDSDGRTRDYAFKEVSFVI